MVPPSGQAVRGAFAFCEPGEKLLSGGHTVVDDPDDPPAPNQSAAWDTFTIEGGPVTEGLGDKVPTDGLAPTGWHAGVQNDSAQEANRNVILQVYAVCAD